jgi:hypothetical protein
MWDWALAEFFFYEIVVVEIFIWKIESVGFGWVGPTGLFVRAAFGASFGVARDSCAAVGADFGRHVRKVETRNPKLEKSAKRPRAVIPFRRIPRQF